MGNRVGVRGGWAAGQGTSRSQVSANPRRVVRNILVHELPAVFLNNRIEQIERDIVVVRIARDDLAFEFWLQEILGRSWNVDSSDGLSVVGIRQRVHRHADILAVRILETLMNLVPTFRLERHQHALLLPSVIVLERLKYRQIDAQFSFGNLAIDDRGQNVAEICGQLDLDARKALLKLPNPRLVEAGEAGTG